MEIYFHSQSMIYQMKNMKFQNQNIFFLWYVTWFPNQDFGKIEFDICNYNIYNYIQPKIVEDIEDVDYPTLEEVITRIEQNRIISVAEEKKKNILEIVRNLAEEFTKITTRYIFFFI